MKKTTLFRTTVSVVATIVLYAGFSSSLIAQPVASHQDMKSIAKQLGVLRTTTPVNRVATPQRAPARVISKRNQHVKANKYDPYKARRQQIYRQNAARRKALKTNLANQKRLKYQRIYQQRKAHRIPQRGAQRNQQPHNRHNNVWNRIYQGFRIRNYNYQPLVQRFTREFSRNPARIQQLADRSSNYLFMVVNELNRRRMPTELALLPFVESAYRNSAYSHAGAAGMWQFIPTTGRRYGLHRTRSYDARLDPMKATRAALTYLQQLNREFRGDWLLALAAYNCGENRVHREIANNRRRGKRTDYWSLNLPRETKQYVPRLLAYKEIFRNPRSFRVHLRGIPNAPALMTIRVNKAVNLRKAAAHAGLPANTLTSINAGFLHGITTPRFSNEIILPRRHAGRLSHVIQRLPPAQNVHNKPVYRRYAKSKKRRRKSSFRYVKVRRGDTLYRIAKKYGTSVKNIKRLNRLRGSRIRPGKRLKIAFKGRRRSYS